MEASCIIDEQDISPTSRQRVECQSLLSDFIENAQDSGHKAALLAYLVGLLEVDG